MKHFLLAAVAATLAMPALAESRIEIDDPYARAAGMTAQAGAAFMVIRNTGDTDDRLVAAASDASKRVELHTHQQDDDGVMRMIHVEEGFEIPAGGEVRLMRGGNHVMFMGLNDPFEQGEMLDVTLSFEEAGDIALRIPVDNDRQPGMGHGGMGHGNMNHDTMDQGS